MQSPSAQSIFIHLKYFSHAPRHSAMLIDPIPRASWAAAEASASFHPAVTLTLRFKTQGPVVPRLTSLTTRPPRHFHALGLLHAAQHHHSSRALTYHAFTIFPALHTVILPSLQVYAILYSHTYVDCLEIIPWQRSLIYLSTQSRSLFMRSVARDHFATVWRLTCTSLGEDDRHNLRIKTHR